MVQIIGLSDKKKKCILAPMTFFSPKHLCLSKLIDKFAINIHTLKNTVC